jgi:hypothetical protein
MVLLFDISGKIPMKFIKPFFHALKETTQLVFGNFSTMANISMSISNSEGISTIATKISIGAQYFETAITAINKKYCIFYLGFY